MRGSSFGRELGAAMFAEGVSFRELARRTGLAAGTLNQYVNERRRPPNDATVERIAAALGRPAEAFFEWRRRRAIEQLDAQPQLLETIYVRTRSR